MIYELQVIHDSKESKLPLLVYMSRERRPSRPHRFKAGALNALVSKVFLEYFFLCFVHKIFRVHSRFVVFGRKVLL